MLAADKLQLQSALKQQATALKEKEFNLHHSNLSEYFYVCCVFLKQVLYSVEVFSNHTHLYPFFFPHLSRFSSIHLKIIIYLRKNKK